MKTNTIKTQSCPISTAVLSVLRFVFLVALVFLILKALVGCVAVNHTLDDGTRIRATAAGVSATTADGKSSVELTLPQK